MRLIKDLGSMSQERFLYTMEEVAQAAWQHAEDKGFHTPYGSGKYNDTYAELGIATRLMLIVGELGEAMEGLRHGNPPSDKIPDFSSMEEELADVVIRIFDLCVSEDYHLAAAILTKMEHNQTREYLHGGKRV